MNPRLLRELRAVVGAEGLVQSRAGRLAYECDGFTFERHVPDLVVLPKDTAQCAAVMARLHRAGVAVVPRGAGTGLTGGATPGPGSVVIGTARMTRVLELNVPDRFARVETGIVNDEVTRAAAHHGLFYAPDPSSQKACTIGGNVANDSGGPHCFKYGNTKRHVLGLVIVTAQGEVLDLSAPELDPAGLDLVGLFTGSEGLFGLATEATLRLVSAPETVETLLAIFPTLEAACDSVSDAIAARLEPSALEIIDKLTIEAVEASVLAAGYPKDAEAVLLIEIDGSEPEVTGMSADLEAIVRARGALEVRRARDSAERARLWAGRKHSFGAMGRLAPDLYVADVVVPRSKLRELVLRSTELCRERGLRVANVFHAGDGNLHPNISFDRRDPDLVRRVLEAGDLIMKLCVAAGGALSGEHGIGLEKREQMCLFFNDDDLEAMARVRAVWDPAGRMNPGKSIPVRRCVEFTGGAAQSEPLT
jgi:glycolate oxidase subunit GlcD